MKTIESLEARVRKLEEEGQALYVQQFRLPIVKKLNQRIIELEAKLKKENETVLFHFNKQRDLEARVRGMSEEYNRDFSQMAQTISDLEAKLKKLEWKNKQFKVYGTDACENKLSCGGRITLFYHSNFCISCNPEDYQFYETKLNQPQTVEGKRNLGEVKAEKAYELIKSNQAINARLKELGLSPDRKVLEGETMDEITERVKRGV